MSELIPAFDVQRVIVAPWTQDFSSSIWIVLMGFFVATACGLVGNYLILRRMALVGDAISHSILPGIAVAFLLSGNRGSLPMFLGALVAGAVTTVLIEVIHKKSRVKQDAAIGIAFTSLFAVGVILISLCASKVDLDQECVLYGEIAFIPLEGMVELAGFKLGPPSVVRMGMVTLVVVLLVGLFYKELLVSSFDPALSFSLGINSTFVHYALMAMLSVVVVSAFEAVGAILVIAMLILPGATATLLSNRFPVMLGLTVLHAALSAVLGLHLGVWLNCSLAGAMVVAGTGLFVAAVLTFRYQQGRLSMKTLGSVGVTIAMVVGIGTTACRKKRTDDAPSTTAAPPAATAAPASGGQPSPASGPVLSIKDQGTIQKQFMSTEVSWGSKTPNQKQQAYYGWCQQYMFGDANTKSRVLTEIRTAGLPPEDIKALHDFNKRQGFPPLP